MNEKNQASEYVLQAPIGELVPFPLNPRKDFNQENLLELTASIKEKGILVPLTVRKVGSRFEVIAGERRLRAAEAIGLETVPVIVKELTDEDALELAIVDNLQRAGVGPLEEAAGFAALIKKGKLTIETIAAKVGKAMSYVEQRLRLLTLIDPAKRALQAGVLTLGHAILIARLQPKDQQRAFQFAVKTWQQFGGAFEYRNEMNPSRDDESHESYHGPARTVCSVADLRKFIDERINLDLHAAAFDTKDAELLPKAGACLSCPKRTGFNKELFSDIGKGDFCTDAECYGAKQAAFVERLKVELKSGKTKYQEITRDQRKPKDHPSAITERSFKYVKGKPCKFTRTGIFIDADMKGKTALICSAKKECTQHFGAEVKARAGRSTMSETEKKKLTPEEAEKQRIKEVRDQIDTEVENALIESLVAILPDVAPVAIDPSASILLEILLDNSDYDAERTVREVFKLKKSADLSKVDKKTLCRAIWTLVILNEKEATYDDGKAFLERMAHLGADVEKFRIDNRKALEEKYAKELKPRILDEPKPTTKKKCEGCGCTEGRACKGGCSWDPVFLSAGRYVCSKCVDSGKVTLKASSKASKKKPARKARTSKKRGKGKNRK